MRQCVPTCEDSPVTGRKEVALPGIISHDIHRHTGNTGRIPGVRRQLRISPASDTMTIREFHERLQYRPGKRFTRTFKDITDRVGHYERADTVDDFGPDGDGVLVIFHYRLDNGTARIIGTKTFINRENALTGAWVDSSSAETPESRRIPGNQMRFDW